MAAVAQPLQGGHADTGTAETGRQLRSHPAGSGMLASYQRTGALEGSLIQIIDNQHQGASANASWSTPFGPTGARSLAAVDVMDPCDLGVHPDFSAGVLDGQSGGTQSPCGSVVCPTSIR
jgi:hypothetical protein